MRQPTAPTLPLSILESLKEKERSLTSQKHWNKKMEENITVSLSRCNIYVIYILILLSSRKKKDRTSCAHRKYQSQPEQQRIKIGILIIYFIDSLKFVSYSRRQWGPRSHCAGAPPGPGPPRPHMPKDPFFSISPFDSRFLRWYMNCTTTICPHRIKSNSTSKWRWARVDFFVQLEHKGARTASNQLRLTVIMTLGESGLNGDSTWRTQSWLIANVLEGNELQN